MSNKNRVMTLIVLISVCLFLLLGIYKPAMESVEVVETPLSQEILLAAVSDPCISDAIFLMNEARILNENSTFDAGVAEMIQTHCDLTQLIQKVIISGDVANNAQEYYEKYLEYRELVLASGTSGHYLIGQPVGPDTEFLTAVLVAHTQRPDESGHYTMPNGLKMGVDQVCRGAQCFIKSIWVSHHQQGGHVNIYDAVGHLRIEPTS